jgi:hypothetical protein
VVTKWLQLAPFGLGLPLGFKFGVEAKRIEVKVVESKGADVL